MQIIRGRVIANSNQIQLFPEHTSGSEHHSHSSHKTSQKTIELLFVKWLNAPFLVPKSEISDFADYTAGLGEYNGYFYGILGSPFLQKFGVKGSEHADELPIFPSGFEKFLKKPIRGQIVSIGKSFRQADPNEYNDANWENLVIPVRVNVGKAQGVTINLKFFFADVESSFAEEVRVKDVGANSSLVEVTRSVRKKNCVVTEHNDCENPEYAKLKVGLKLSTTGF